MRWQHVTQLKYQGIFERLLALLVLAVLGWGVLGAGVSLALAEDSALHPVDASPLAGRQPLILIHGINPDRKALYSWEDFLTAAKANPRFEERLKPYLFVYDPALPVAQNGELLKNTLRTHLAQAPEAPAFRIVALSLGGLILNPVMQDPELARRIDRVVAVGVPFHGSPLASAAWMRSGLKQAAFFSPVRRANRLAYWLTARKFPHFGTDFCWDNFDGAISPALFGKQPCPRVTGASIPEQYILYAAFFGASESEQAWLAQHLACSAPDGARTTRGNVLSRHLMFRLVQPQMMQLSQPDPESEMPSIYAFNDGISPISSQLWLGQRVAAQDGILSQSAQWEAVSALRGAAKARLFEGLDHRDWLIGKTRYRHHNGAVQDWLHPGESAKTIYEWLLTDLLAD